MLAKRFGLGIRVRQAGGLNCHDHRQFDLNVGLLPSTFVTRATRVSGQSALPLNTNRLCFTLPNALMAVFRFPDGNC